MKYTNLEMATFANFQPRKSVVAHLQLQYALIYLTKVSPYAFFRVALVKMLGK